MEIPYLLIIPSLPATAAAPQCIVLYDPMIHSIISCVYSACVFSRDTEFFHTMACSHILLCLACSRYDIWQILWVPLEINERMNESVSGW